MQYGNWRQPERFKSNSLMETLRTWVFLSRRHESKSQIMTERRYDFRVQSCVRIFLKSSEKTKRISIAKLENSEW